MSELPAMLGQERDERHVFKTLMRVKELIKRLNRCDPNKKIVFYFLENYDLGNCEYETLLECDNVELTIKKCDSDEGGNT